MQTVSQVMTRGVRTLAPEDSLTDAAETMRDLDVGSLPICDKDRLVGMVTDRDIVIRGLAEKRPNGCVKDVMTPEPLYCYDDEPVETAVQTMQSGQVRRLPIVDRDKRLVGVLALGDVALSAKDQAGDALSDISEPSP